jgi:dihydrodipicolinate synthase/N-acetylneuraminate lyase
MTATASTSSAHSALDGIVAVPATPFTEDNRVDVESLRRYARHALACGAVGFLAPAIAGEAETLSEAERELVISTLLEEAAGRVPVIGGATTTEPAPRLRLARRYVELGCPGVLAHIRYEDDASYNAAVRELATLNPGFLMLQDLDAGAVPVPLIARLHREIPCFTWIKVETSDRGRKLSAIRAAAGPSLRLGTAGPDLIELLDRGVDSYLSTFTPGVYARIWELHRASRRDDAIALYRRLLPALAFMATHQKIQWRFTKALLHAEGLFATTHIRIAAPALDGAEERLIAELANYAKELSHTLTP